MAPSKRETCPLATIMNSEIIVSKLDVDNREMFESCTVGTQTEMPSMTCTETQTSWDTMFQYNVEDEQDDAMIICAENMCFGKKMFEDEDAFCLSDDDLRQFLREHPDF